MEIKILSSIKEIDPQIWDSIVTNKDIFNSYQFLLSLEESKVEDADIQYFTLWDNNVLVANAVFSAFRINLDLFIGDNKMIQWIKRIKPDFFKLKILFCGTPVSIGHKNICYSNDVDINELVSLLVIELQKIAKKDNIKHMIFKEFFNEDVQIFEKQLIHSGYFKGNSIPYIILPLKWKTFEEYLESLKSTFRRQINASLKKINTNKPVIQYNYFQSEMIESYPVLSILKPLDFPPKYFFELYCSVMSRATIKLEMLNEAFFVSFFKNMNNHTKILALMYQGKILGATLFVENQPDITFVWTAKDQLKDELYDNYFNLLIGMIAYAIENGNRNLNLGQTAYYTKQRLGGYDENLFIYFKSRSWFWHNCIKLLKNTFFPEFKLNKIVALKTNTI